jgi:hypothetical protein
MRLCSLVVGSLLALCMDLYGQEVRRAVPSQGVQYLQPVPVLAGNDVANFLAGVLLPDASSLSSLQRTSWYKEHVRALAKLSQRFDRNYYSKMRAWSAAELASRIPMRVPVYYFFGGPDAVSPLALFPDAPVYILGGLESVGSIMPPNALPPEEVAFGLENLRRSAEVILSFGHFITRDMKAELDRTAFRGVLPLIYMFIALTGGEIVSTRYIAVVGGGAVRELGSESVQSKGQLPGVRVEFRGRGRSDVQTLIYVQANVADDFLKSNGSLLQWASSHGAGNVYLKAASYLLHEPYFSRIRSFLLDYAISVLQDDSGIPFRYFGDGRWQLWLFGSYTGTLETFAKYYQSDLQSAFATPRAAASLPFGTGYKWRLGESNLMLAIKQQSASPANVPTQR